jgi:hypothetical protein
LKSRQADDALFAIYFYFSKKKEGNNMKGKKRPGLVGPCMCGLFSAGIAAWAWLFFDFFSHFYWI